MTIKSFRISKILLFLGIKFEVNQTLKKSVLWLVATWKTFRSKEERFSAELIAKMQNGENAKWRFLLIE